MSKDADYSPNLTVLFLPYVNQILALNRQPAKWTRVTRQLAFGSMPQMQTFLSGES